MACKPITFTSLLHTSTSRNCTVLTGLNIQRRISTSSCSPTREHQHLQLLRALPPASTRATAPRLHVSRPLACAPPQTRHRTPPPARGPFFWLLHARTRPAEGCTCTQEDARSHASIRACTSTRESRPTACLLARRRVAELYWLHRTDRLVRPCSFPSDWHIPGGLLRPVFNPDEN